MMTDILQKIEVFLIAFKYYNQLLKIFKDDWNKHVQFNIVTNEPTYASARRTIFEKAELVEFEQSLQLILTIELEQRKLNVVVGR
jgi:ABC-type polysaccharide transport system permease subunit